MSNKKESKLNKIFVVEDWIENILLLIAGVSLVIMLAITTYSILAREVFSSPTLWTNDLASYLMVYIVFLSAPWVLRVKGHVTVDLLFTSFKGGIKKGVIIFISIISIIACFFYFLFSLDIVTLYFNNGSIMYDSLPIPQFLVYLPMPIGSFFLMIRFSLMILELFIVNNNEIEIFDEEGGY